MKETELEWLRRNRSLINLTETANYIGMNRGNLKVTIDGKRPLPTKYLTPLKRYIKEFELREK